MISLSISIVSYNTRDLLRRCLASLEQVARDDNLQVQIIVADNGSTDGSMEMVEQEYSGVERISLGANLGYGEANNRALERATGRYFLILNSDTEVEPGSLRNFVDFLDTHPDVGAAGARLISPDGSTQLSWSKDPTLFWTFCEQTFLDRLPIAKQLIFGFNRTRSNEEEQSVDQVPGAALLVRREVFQQIGGFDKNFFMYYEDTDLCMRIRRAGYKIFYLPQVRVKHILGASSKSLSLRADMVVACNRSRIRFFHLHHGISAARAVKSLALLGAFLRCMLWSGVFLTPMRNKGQAFDKLKMFRNILRRTLNAHSQ